MFSAGKGLTEVATRDLEKALRALHRDQLACPLTPVSLNLAGLGHVVEPLTGLLRGLDAAAVRAVLVAVLAERRARP